MNATSYTLDFTGTPAGRILDTVNQENIAAKLSDIFDGLRNPIKFFAELSDFDDLYVIKSMVRSLYENHGLNHDIVTDWIEANLSLNARVGLQDEFVRELILFVDETT